MERVIDQGLAHKIQGLINLSEGAATEGEAEAAAGALQKLLTKYQLSLSDVDGTKDDEIGPHQSGIFGKRIRTWKKYLAMGIAECNNCKVVVYSSRFRGTSFKELKFVGHKTDCDISALALETLVKLIEIISGFQSTGKGRNYADSFKKGIALRIAERLKEAKKETIQEAMDENSLATTAAIVRLDGRQEAVKVWYKEQEFGKGAVNKNKVNIRAFKDGIEAGDNVDLGSRKKINDTQAKGMLE